MRSSGKAGRLAADRLVFDFGVAVERCDSSCLATAFTGQRAGWISKPTTQRTSKLNDELGASGRESRAAGIGDNKSTGCLDKVLLASHEKRGKARGVSRSTFLLLVVQQVHKYMYMPSSKEAPSRRAVHPAAPLAKNDYLRVTDYYPCPRIPRTCQSSRHQPLQLLGLMATVPPYHTMMVQTLVHCLEKWRTCHTLRFMNNHITSSRQITRQFDQPSGSRRYPAA